MAATERVQRIRIYLTEHDRHEGEPLYLAILEVLRREGATGATALRGPAGFGPGTWNHSGAVGALTTKPPIVIEWVERSERVARIIATIDPLIANALVTVEQVVAYRAVLRRTSFGEGRSAGDVMRPATIVVRPETALPEAIALMAEHQLSSLPVVDGAGSVVGLLSERDLRLRGRLAVAPRYFTLLSPAEQQGLLAELRIGTVAGVLGDPPPPFPQTIPVARALAMMIERGLDHIAVSRPDGRIAGVLDEQIALTSAAESAASAADDRSAAPPAAVHLVMQTHVPTVAADASLGAALTLLCQRPDQRLCVVAADQRLLGTISLASVLTELHDEARSAFLAALRQGSQSALPPFPERDLAILIDRDPPTLAANQTMIDAARILVERRAASLPVVEPDPDGGQARLIGMVTRGGILRALAQESES